MDAYMAVLQKYAQFSGRSSRQEYWMFFVINFAIGIGIAILGSIIGPVRYVGMLYNLAIFIPSLAVLVRRLHDTGKTGWWWLACFTIIGIPLVIWFLALEGDKGDNQYGPAPVDGAPAFA
jgi:uncharacterized membrane protein YhaH (DUF805 family)